MCTYYMSRAEAYKKNTKELSKLINPTISKQKNKGSVISHITVDGLKITNGQEIADSFANHYANVGSILASKIKQGNSMAHQTLWHHRVQIECLYLHLLHHYH